MALEPRLTITEVRTGSQGEKIGLYAGDVLISVDEHPVRDNDTLGYRLRQCQEGGALMIERDGDQIEIQFGPGPLGIISEILNHEMDPAVRKFREAAKQVQITTAQSLDGYRVVKTIEVITAECAFGVNAFRDFFVGVTDVFGGRSKSIQTVLRDARKTVLNELRNEAATVGANAVIATDLDYSEFSGKGTSMLFLVASGTAVVVEPLGSDLTRGVQ